MNSPQPHNCAHAILGILGKNGIVKKMLPAADVGAKAGGLSTEYGVTNFQTETPKWV